LPPSYLTPARRFYPVRWADPNVWPGNWASSGSTALRCRPCPSTIQAPISPDVVQAVFRALTDLDPGKIEDLLAAETGVTLAEYQQAKDLYLASAIAGLDQQERKLKVFQVLTANRQLIEGTGWADLYDSLTAGQVTELRELYDAMPDGARAEYDRRYGRPEEI
jgi:hypothetical protein